MSGIFENKGFENEAIKADMKHFAQEKAVLQEALHDLSMKLQKSKANIRNLLKEKMETSAAKEIIEKELEEKQIEIIT